MRLSGTGAPVVQARGGDDDLNALRPSYSVLDNMMLRISGIALLPDWKVMLEAYMEQWRRRRQDPGMAGMDWRQGR